MTELRTNHAVPRATRFGMLAGLGLLAALQFGCGGADVTRSAPPAFELDSFEWARDVAPLERVLIRNEFGDVRVRGSDDGQVRIAATIQKIGAAGDEFEVRAEPGVSMMLIEIVSLVDAPTGRVDVAVLVPPAMQVAVETTTGAIQFKGFPGAAVARSDSGNITVIRPGHIRAASQSGSVAIEVGDTLPDFGPLACNTETGDIRVLLPPDASIRVSATTGGEIASSLPGAAGAGSTPGAYQALIGAGEREVKVTSISGKVRIEPAF